MLHPMVGAATVPIPFDPSAALALGGCMTEHWAIYINAKVGPRRSAADGRTDRALRVLFVSSEIFPLAKTGGLADVSASLPAALARQGIEPLLFMPGYPKALDTAVNKRVLFELSDQPGFGQARIIAGQMPDTGLPVWLLDAPTAGTVVNLKVHSTGGVVAPGDPMMELVPAMDRLIVAARVEPHDADVVHIGLNSQVRLTAYNQRHALPLEGRVTYMSADRLTDERTGQHYYEARVELNENAIVGDRTIYPGMPAEVIIVTAAHTLADYLLEPLSGVFRRSLREKQ